MHLPVIRRDAMPNLFILFLTSAILLSWTSSNVALSGRVPPRVTINKCCRVGEQMDKTKQCYVGGTEKWVPPVWLLNKKGYFMPKGEAPKFFSIQEETIPKCAELELFTGASQFAIFSNGTLFISEKSLSVSTEDYCVEKDLALVCLPTPIISNADSLTAPSTKLSKVKKCCGQNSMYDKAIENCVSLVEGHPVQSQSVINLTSVDILYGFPECITNSQYTRVGNFNVNNFDDSTGTYRLESGEEFIWNDYCLEHTAADLNTNVNVFTCAEHFSSPDSVPVAPQVSLL